MKAATLATAIQRDGWLYSGPFARRPREGWTTWGNEIALAPTGSSCVSESHAASPRDAAPSMQDRGSRGTDDSNNWRCRLCGHKERCW